MPPTTVGVLLGEAGHELRTPLNAICGFTELALAGSLGPVSAPMREALQAMAHAARTLEITAETIVACRHALPRQPWPAAVPVDLAEALQRAGFELVGVGSDVWPTVAAEVERFDAGLAAARRWLGRHTGTADRACARLSADGPGSLCVLSARGPRQPGEGLGELDLSLARLLLSTDGVGLRARGDALELVRAGG